MFPGNVIWRLYSRKWLSGFCYFKFPAVVPEKGKLVVLLTDWNSSQVELKDTTRAPPAISDLRGASEAGTTSLMMCEMFHLFITSHPPTYSITLFLVVSLPLRPFLVLCISRSLHLYSHSSVLLLLQPLLASHLVFHMLPHFTLCSSLQ